MRQNLHLPTSVKHFILSLKPKAKREFSLAHKSLELLRDDKFDSITRGKEKSAWEAFRSVVENFLGNFKTNDYRERVENLLNHIKIV